ncbi:MAG: CRISPR-associated endonuclease Cas2 [Psychrilyobacter sp.]|uniref:CRISPR-associated endonuclease Cas2 n=1 Tax=Psychrilyobacter sp. TaxID=2586924 RepID=UPI003C73947B
MYIILTYDIKLDDKGAKVWRHVFKICKKYLTHIQNSVFEGELTKPLLEKLRLELKEFIRSDKDSLIVFESKAERYTKKHFWGIEDDKTSNFF